MKIHYLNPFDNLTSTKITDTAVYQRKETNERKQAEKKDLQ